MQKITPAQNRKIHTLKRALAWDDATYQAALKGQVGVETSKGLPIQQAKKVIGHLEELAVRAGVWTRQGRRFDHLDGRSVDMATPKQLRLIEVMWGQVSRATTNAAREKALRAFVKRITKAADLRFLRKHQAEKVVKALEKMGATKED